MTATAPAVDPVDYVKSLPIESREKVYIELLREFSPANLHATDVPSEPTPEFQQFLATLDPEVAAKLMEPLPADFDPDDILSEDEIKAILRGDAGRTAS